MKLRIVFILSIFLLTMPCRVSALPVYPDAEGFGSDTVGGRVAEATLYKVTNTNDSGAGSLREALEASGSRIVIFRTGGTISLASGIDINDPNITVFGQTAPGDGICIKIGSTFNDVGNRKAIRIVNTHDVFLQNLRIRAGDLVGWGPDPIGIHGLGTDPGVSSYNIVIDHCSFSWGTDTTIGQSYSTHDVTWSWNIISEGLALTGDIGHHNGAQSNTILSDSTASWDENEWAGGKVYNWHDVSSCAIASNTATTVTCSPGLAGGTDNLWQNQDHYSITLEDDPNHAWGALIGADDAGGFTLADVTMHHNYFVHNYFRSPLIQGNSDGIELINNLIYNWGNSGCRLDDKTKADFIKNYGVKGPMNPGGGDAEVIKVYQDTGQGGELYALGNISPGRPTDAGDDWLAVVHTAGQEAEFRVEVSTVVGSTVTHTAVEEVPSTLRTKVGAFPRDSVDTRVIQDFLDVDGDAIVSQDDVGGWPTYSAGTPPADSDSDGLPDSWEDMDNCAGTNKLLDDTDSDGTDDWAEDCDADGYWNIEEYAYYLLSGMPPPPPASSTSSITISSTGTGSTTLSGTGTGSITIGAP